MIGADRQRCLQIICITGATGSLGAHLLLKLLQHYETTSVWCLVRAKDDQEATERVKRSLELRNLPGSFSEYEGRITCLAADLKLGQFGLSDDVYKRLCEGVKHVVHVAWPVNCENFS